MNEFSFSSKEELYERVKPALQAKMKELHRLGYGYIQKADVWNYLIITKWLKAKDLRLAEVVDDILHVDAESIDWYLKDRLTKEKRHAYFHQDIEIV